MKFSTPFPNGQMNPLLRKFGFQESDILEIREMLLEEVKRQNNLYNTQNYTGDPKT